MSWVFRLLWDFGTLPDTFYSSLSTGDTTKAFQIWSTHAEKLLIKVAQNQAHQIRSSTIKRGDIKFSDTRMYPKIIQGQASTLSDRKMWKNICRSIECQKAPPGVRRDRTWKAIQEILPYLSPHYQPQLLPILNSPVDNDKAKEVEQILKSAYQQQCRENSQARLKFWKQNIRSSASETANWLKNRKKPAILRVAVTDQGQSANCQSRMSAIRHAWSKIFEAHKNGEPSLHQFMQKFGPTLKRSLLSLTPITPQQILHQISIVKITSPGLDKWSYRELKSLALWCPTMYTHLAALFNSIEDDNPWPDPFKMGLVHFIPKEVEGGIAEPLQHRPITILSCLYRTWSAIRHQDLSKSWQQAWIPAGAYGVKSSKSADILTYHTCCDIESAIRSRLLPGGLSYDFEKCFDSIPCQLAINILRMRGCDSKVCVALDSFYSQHQKIFNLDGHYDQPFIPANGIVQGCPLSMLILTSMVACWHEAIIPILPEVKPRSYADDLSAIVSKRNQSQIKAAVRQIHNHTHMFASAAGLKINASKTFTFGHQCIEKSLPSIQNHKDAFRLTGGVVKVSPKQCWSELEAQRAQNWSDTTKSIRKLPVGWFAKVSLLQQRSSQLTWGHGTHKLSLSKSELRTMRADVVRCLLNADDYRASPTAIFTLLAPPSLDPEFSLHYNALTIMQRAFSEPQQIQHFAERVAATNSQHDGPAARAHQLLDHPVFQDAVRAALRGQMQSPKLPHELREKWRIQIWKNLARDRPQAFSGLQHGLKRKLSTSLLDLWARQADILQQNIDQQICQEPDPLEDPRPRMKVLRLLLVAGLMNPESNHRHRKLEGDIKCTCGGIPTHHHITWECPLFQQFRVPALQALPAPIETLPICFQYCTLVPSTLDISPPALHQIQSSLVTVWQHHILMWNEGSNIANVHHVPNEPSNNAPPDDPQVLPAERKGHLLQPMPEGTGMFCVKCGIYTTYLKHVRSKILKNQCKFAHLPSTKWLAKPGMQQATNRLDEEERKLKEELNKANHDLVWNRKTGRDAKKQETYGLIFCRKCRRLWPWCQRHANLPRTLCRESANSQPTPQWVIDLSHSNPPTDNPAPVSRRSIRGKTTPASSSTHNPNANLSQDVRDPSAASSAGIHTPPRAGIG